MVESRYCNLKYRKWIHSGSTSLYLGLGIRILLEESPLLIGTGWQLVLQQKEIHGLPLQGPRLGEVAQLCHTRLCHVRHLVIKK